MLIRDLILQARLWHFADCNYVLACYLVMATFASVLLFVTVVLLTVNCLPSSHILKDSNDGHRVLSYSIEWPSELCHSMLMHGNK